MAQVRILAGVTSLMHFQARRFEKTFPTNLADMRPILCMPSPVEMKARSRTEAAVALRTLELLLFRMRQHVRLERSDRHEFPANVAYNHSLFHSVILVAPHVLRVPAFVVEFLLTTGTNELRVFAIAQHQTMAIETVLAAEPLSTTFTFERQRQLLGVNIAKMCRQIRHRFAAFRTTEADVLLLFVTLQSLLGGIR